MKEIIFDGDAFSDLAGFYDEVERKLTKNLDWKIGRNLNAYNDILRGGFGIHKYHEEITVRWRNASKSKAALGQSATIEYLKQISKICHPSSASHIAKDLAKMEEGKGKTLFKLIVDITKSHEHIKLKLE